MLIKKPLLSKLALRLLLLLAIVWTTGCASSVKRNQGINAPVYDPLEKVNRKIFRFNQIADKYVLAPVARGYKAVLPGFAEAGIRNFFSNLGEVSTIANDLLQGKFYLAARDSGRLILNSTAGVLGFFDPATSIGLEKNNESWGQTFGVWGIGEGPYLVLPLLGPANVRTLAGRIVNSNLTEPIQLIDHNRTRLSFTITEVISIRAELLGASRLLESAALDPYSFLRAGFATRHRSLVRDLDKTSGRKAKKSEEADELDLLDEEDELDLLDEEDELDQLDVEDELDLLEQEDESDLFDVEDELDLLEQEDKSDLFDVEDELDLLEEEDELDRLEQ